MAEAIRRAILMSFSNSTYMASVLLMEATNAFVSNVPVATHIDGTSAIVGATCAVLFFDENNSDDALVLAIYPQGNQGVPSPPPGTVTLITPITEINAVVINAGATTTFTMTGLPSGILGMVIRGYFSSPTVGANILLGPTGSTILNYGGIGNVQVANGFVSFGGVIAVSTNTQIDIKAQTGNCTVSLFCHGYLI